MLELQNIKKVFYPGTINEKVALSDLSLKLEDGDFVTVIGGNGAGKSTLLNLIAGTYPADGGSILLDGVELTRLRVDGGASVNRFLMQFQADISGVPVIRPAITETTALGAAFLAGLSTGVWESCEEISALWRVDRVFEPSMTADRREYLMNQWARAVGRARNWNK